MTWPMERLRVGGGIQDCIMMQNRGFAGLKCGACMDKVGALKTNVKRTSPLLLS